MVKDGKCVNGVYANTCSASNLLQKMHENVCVIYACKCPVWVISCITKFLFWVNVLLDVLQAKAFSSVWLISCL